MGGKVLEYEARTIKETAERIGEEKGKKNSLILSARWSFEDGVTYEVIRNRIPADIISDDELNAIREEVIRNK